LKLLVSTSEDNRRVYSSLQKFISELFNICVLNLNHTPFRFIYIPLYLMALAVPETRIQHEQHVTLEKRNLRYRSDLF
jgi:hypothetical protein